MVLGIVLEISLLVLKVDPAWHSLSAPAPRHAPCRQSPQGPISRTVGKASWQMDYTVHVDNTTFPPRKDKVVSTSVLSLMHLLVPPQVRHDVMHLFVINIAEHGEEVERSKGGRGYEPYTDSQETTYICWEYSSPAQPPF